MSQASPSPPAAAATGHRLITACLFGLAFGFLLQKGGVAKYNVLIGQLLLQDFTVVKIMGSAVVVGMLGIYTLHHLGKVKLHLKPTRLGPQAVGGVLFGIGFGLLAYCPGTGAAALGQGSWDMLYGVAGLMAGSYLYAELEGWLQGTIGRWGDLGRRTVPDLLNLPRLPFAWGAAVLIAAGLYLLHRAVP